MTPDLTRAEVRIRVSCCADELNKIKPEVLAHVFARYPELETKCREAMKLRKGTP